MSNIAIKVTNNLLPDANSSLDNQRVEGGTEEMNTVINLDLNIDPLDRQLAQMDQRFLAILPEKIRNFIRDRANVDALPVGCYLNPIIGAFAQAGGGAFEVRFREYVNRSNVYLLTVGGPSSGKSTGERVILAEVKNKDSALLNQSDNKKHAIIPSSTSYQALQEVLIHSKSVLFSPGELVSLVGHLTDKQGDGHQWLNLFLDLYTNTSIKRVFRGEGTTRTEDAILSVIANTQPKNFIHFTGYLRDGLSQRFLVWPLPRRRGDMTSQYEPGRLTDPIGSKLRAVYDFEKDLHRFNIEDDQQANEAVCHYLNKIRSLQNSSTDELELELLGKDEINLFKLILILHLMYNADSNNELDSPITASVVHKAYELLELYREAYLLAYNHFSGLTAKGKRRKPDVKQICSELLELNPDLNQSKFEEATKIPRNYFAPSANKFISKRND